MTRRWVVVAVLAVLLLLVVPVSADLLDGWSARKSHVINNTGDALSDYQVKFIVHRSDGSDSGDDVYIGSSGCESDYDDIRFTKSDGTTLLDYWIEESDSSDATIWVEVDSIAGSDDTTIYLYYGNAGASAVSSGDDTFDFFDDFDGGSVDTDKWDIDSGSPSVADSNIVVSGDDIYSDNTFGPGVAYRTKVKYNVVGGTSNYFMQNGFQSIEAARHTVAHSLSTYSNKWDSYDADYELTSASGVTANTYCTFEIKWPSSSSVTFTVDDTDVATHTSQVPDDPMYVRLRADSTVGTTTLTSDWVLIRKYAATEPSHGAWGSEESIYEITTDFSGVPTSGIVPLTVYFTDNSSSTGDLTVTIDTWSWDFGDGTTSTDQNPAHQYTTSGTYTVALTASNATYGTTDTETKTDYITVSIDPSAPVADFVATPLCEDVGDPIYFIDYSTGGGLYAWNWSFGDSSYSELRNPTHTYASNGTYDISLTVWGANGTDTLTKTGYITIPCGAPTPTPTVTGTTPTPTSSVTPGEVTESNVTYIYSDDQTFVPWALWLAVVGVMIAFFGHSLIFTRNTDLTATMACVLAFVAAGLSNMIGYIDIGVAAVGTDVAITPMIKAVHPPWLVYVMVMFALVSVLNIVYQAWRLYLKPKDWSAIYRKRYERY